MSAEFNPWLIKFLEQRGLTEPDGRPLFSYRCETEEYDELCSILSNISTLIKLNNQEKLHLVYPGIERLFVLYCAEWWRRNYIGGPWKWLPIFDSVCWPNFDFNNRCNLVERGLRFWKRELLQPGKDREFLLTVACEGGLPVNLIQNHYSYLRSFLKAVLKDYGTYAITGVEAIEFATIHKEYLPPSLQQPILIELSGMLISSIWELQSKITQDVSPVEELDRINPDWRQKLPMSLEDEAANALVIALLDQAKKLRSNTINKFSIVRKLVKTDEHWQLHAELNLPETINCGFIKNELMVTNSPGERLELQLSYGQKMVRVSSLVKQGELYNVYPYNRRQLQIRENSDAEIRCLIFDRGRQIGHLPLPGGSLLNGELPLIFVDREGDERILDFLGQGSVSSSFSEVYMLTNVKPIANILNEDKNKIELIGDQIPLFNGKMSLLKLTGEFKITVDDSMTCVIRTNQSEESKVEYRFEGRQCNLIDAKYPAFLGIPQVKQLYENEWVKKVSDSELLWAKTIGKRNWLKVNESPPRGLVELRHVRDDECLFASRVIILPEKAEIRLVTGAIENQGAIELKEFETSFVSCEEQEDFIFNKIVDGSNITLNFFSENAIPGKVYLKIIWNNGCHCEFGLPFPIEGARFVASGGRVLESSHSLTLDNLYGCSAVAISLRGGQRFSIQGKLKARDIDDNKMQNVVSFKVSLIEVAGNVNVYELPLLQLFHNLQSLFNQSTDPDAIVTLELYRNNQREAKLDIRQFSAKLKFDIAAQKLFCDAEITNIVNEFKTQSIELLPLFDPEAESYFVNPENALAAFHNLLDYILSRGSWLAVAPDNIRRRYRPCLIPTNGQKKNSIDSDSILIDIVTEPDYDTRTSLIQDIFQEMSNDLHHDQWPVFIKYIRRFATVHPNCLDWIRIAIEYPRILIELLLVGGPDIFEIVYEWEEYLPFKWWMLPLREWEYVIRNYLQPFENDEQTRQILLKNIFRNLKKIAERNASFIVALEFLQNKYTENRHTTNCLGDVKNLGISKSWNQIERCFLQNIFREKADDKWPVGIDRDEWCKLVAPEQQPCLHWLKQNQGYQKPILDAPLAAAYFAVLGIYPKQNHRVYLSIFKEFQPDWFDDVFRAVQAILLTQLVMEKDYER